jgi:hypothetical protein
VAACYGSNQTWSGALHLCRESPPLLASVAPSRYIAPSAGVSAGTTLLCWV